MARVESIKNNEITILFNVESHPTPAPSLSLLLALPLSPLCAPDCPGPDPARFPAGVQTDTGHGEEASTGDPRWSVLDVLRRPARGSGDA